MRSQLRERSLEKSSSPSLKRVSCSCDVVLCCCLCLSLGSTPTSAATASWFNVREPAKCTLCSSAYHSNGERPISSDARESKSFSRTAGTLPLLLLLQWSVYLVVSFPSHQNKLSALIRSHIDDDDDSDRKEFNCCARAKKSNSQNTQSPGSGSSSRGERKVTMATLGADRSNGIGTN